MYGQQYFVILSFVSGKKNQPILYNKLNLLPLYPITILLFGSTKSVASACTQASSVPPMSRLPI